jgi:pimeloyl-ACP methyl ester carboxylesterase
MVDHSSRIKISAGQISWHEAGDARHPVVIFLHGSWDDSNQWDELIQPLSKKFHCFAIDLLGFGNSVATEIPNSIDVEVECLHEFLTVLKLRPIYFVGHSLGGWVAVSYTLKYPEFVQGVVTISPEGFATNWQQYGQFTQWLLARPRLFNFWLKGLGVITAIADGSDPLVKKQAYWKFFQRFPTTCRLLFQRPIEDIQRELVANRLLQFRRPFLVLQSDTDDLSIIEQSKSYAKAVRNSEYKAIKDTESMPEQECLLQIMQEIQDFIDRVQVKIDREETELW